MSGDLEHDNFLWLEDVHGHESLKWVEAHNQITSQDLQSRPAFAENFAKISQVLLASDRLPLVGFHGGRLYGFWQDQEHKRGLFRRTSLMEYRQANPNWEIVLDVDQLAAQENEDWVLQHVLHCPMNKNRCLIALSRGGLDARVVREFDLEKKEFVKGGFEVPQAKTMIAWASADSVLVASDFGPDSMTSAGYPRRVKFWRRGEALSESREVFQAELNDSSVILSSDLHAGRSRIYIYRNLDFFTDQTYIFDPASEKIRRLDKPLDAVVTCWFNGRDILHLRGEWRGAKAGSVLAMAEDGRTEMVYQPEDNQSIEGIHNLRDSLLLNIVDSVQGKVAEVRRAGDMWTAKDIGYSAAGDMSVLSTDSDGEDFLVHFQGFLTPPSILHSRAGASEFETIKSLPSRFDAENFLVEQRWVVSRDGTRVPYFFIGPKDLKPNGDHPVLIYGYGGFETSIRPSYVGFEGAVWLQKGGCLVETNIRGGGEFGPSWHRAALKENRQRAFDDFQKIAEDVIERRISNPTKIAIQGRSNGGLLVGACYTQRPDLYAAVICGVPLLDMLRYHKLLAGASWIAEYGNPEIAEEREYIVKYSPYQNLRAGRDYPEVFFYTSTTDDRVHPGHARKMAAKMKELGQKFLYFENTVGGHAGSADPAQEAHVQALIYTFLQSRLMD